MKYIILLMLFSVLAACASQLSDDERFAMEYAKIEREESIRNFIYSCEAGGNAIVYTGGSYHKLRDPVRQVPSQARLSEYQCVQAAALARQH